MSVVTIRTATDEQPASGQAMDRAVQKRGLSPRLRLVIGAALATLVALAAFLIAPDGRSQTVARGKLAIAPAVRGQFEDYLPLRARVTPLVTVYLDAVEGGRVDKLFVEDGAMVRQGQPLAVLSNSDLQLNLLARQTEVAQQLNSLRSQELALSQTRLANERALIDADLVTAKAQRQYNLEKPLSERGFVAARTFNDTQDELQASRRRSEALQRAQANDERLQSSQLAQLRTSAASLSAGLEIARASLDALNLRAPVSGQLTAFSIQVGQSMKRGERLGQIDSAGRNKLFAEVDEYYLGRIQPGQQALAEWGGRNYRLKVAKIYPQVRDGTFAVDFQFAGDEPADVQRGQTLQLRLTLGDTQPALLVPAGGFYNDTGGAWIFVVEGDKAVKRSVRLGRRNPDYIEVLDGLRPGEQVITSAYTGYADKDRLGLE